MIVLETNVLSELMRPTPSSTVVAWVAQHGPRSLYVTSLTEAEILFGIALLAPRRRRASLQAAATRMFESEFRGRVLSFDSAAAPLYARIASDRRRGGRPISHFDAQIAAITRAAQGTLATRNTADFERCGIDLVDPFRA